MHTGICWFERYLMLCFHNFCFQNHNHFNNNSSKVTTTDQINYVRSSERLHWFHIKKRESRVVWSPVVPYGSMKIFVINYTRFCPHTLFSLYLNTIITHTLQRAVDSYILTLNYYKLISVNLTIQHIMFYCRHLIVDACNPCKWMSVHTYVELSDVIIFFLG